MKKLLAIACIIATPGLLLSAEKPDGALGTNSISFSAAYANLDFSHYQSGMDLDFAGVSLGFNQSISKGQPFSMDMNASFSYMTNQNYSEIISLDARMTMIGLTFYREGMLSPFFRPVIGYGQLKTDYDNFSEDDDSWLYGGRIGVEIHIKPGLSMTPYASYLNASEDALGSNTEIGLNMDFWANERLGIIAGVMYSKEYHVDAFGVSLGAAMHF